MPTSWKRIPVTKDPALAEALDEVTRFYPGFSSARLVHDLAIKGAEVVRREEAARPVAIEHLVALSTGELDLLDRDILERIDQLAWED